MSEPLNPEVVAEAEVMSDEQQPAPEAAVETTSPQPDQKPEDPRRTQEKQQLAAAKLQEIKDKVAEIESLNFPSEEDKNEAITNYLAGVLKQYTDRGEDPVIINALIAEQTKKMQEADKDQQTNSAEFYEEIRKEAVKKVVEQITRLLVVVNEDNLKVARELLDKSTTVANTNRLTIVDFIENDKLDVAKLTDYVEKNINLTNIVKEAVLGNELVQHFQKVKEKYEKSAVGRGMKAAENASEQFEKLLEEFSPMGALEFMFRVNSGGYDGYSRFAGKRYGEQDNGKEKDTIAIFKEVLGDPAKREIFYQEFFKEENNDNVPSKDEWVKRISEMFVSKDDVEKAQKLEEAKFRIIRAFKKVNDTTAGLSGIADIKKEDLNLTPDVIMLLGVMAEKAAKTTPGQA